jgi:transposase-like protein
MDHIAVNEGVLPQITPSGVGPGVLDPGPLEALPPVGASDDVATGKRKKRGGSNIGRINAAKQLRSADRSMQLKELICEQGYSINKAAREIGITPRQASKLWQVWVRRLAQIRDGTTEEIQKGTADVLVYCEHHVRGVIERCAAMLEVGPAYAAGALRGVELLAKLHRINLDAPASGDEGSKASVDDILQQAKERAGGALAGLAVSVEVLAEGERQLDTAKGTGPIRAMLQHAGG